MRNLSGFKTFLGDGPPEKPAYMDTEIVNLYVHNPLVRVSELANQAGISVSEFYRILTKYNVKPCRLNAQQGLVRSYSEDGHSVSDIARLTGYTPRNVRYILTKHRQNETGA
jgi:AraC-like DNA-binding protein